MKIIKKSFTQNIIFMLAASFLFVIFIAQALAQSNQNIETVRGNLITESDFDVLDSFIDKFFEKGNKVRFGLDVTLCGGSIYYSDDDKPLDDRQPYEMGIKCLKENNSMTCHITMLNFIPEEYDRGMIDYGVQLYLTGPFQATIYTENGRYVNLNQNPSNNCNRVTGYFTNVQNGGMHQGVRTVALSAIPGN
ncbi:MAG: hypothetical protein LBF38_05455 [Deltaproteobacteria bacterium]|jgi:hypothetical protein|nr:hypothetical protein [Deltaproteobacteria bacterium]